MGLEVAADCRLDRRKEELTTNLFKKPKSLELVLYAGLFNALVFGGIAMTESGMQQVLTK